MSSNVTTWCIVKNCITLWWLIYSYFTYTFSSFIFLPLVFHNAREDCLVLGLYKCTWLEWISSPILCHISALGVGDTDGSSI